MRPPYRVSPLEGLQSRIGESVQIEYDDGSDVGRAIGVAIGADAVVIFAGMVEGFESEGYDRPDMSLPGCQDELISAVAQANGCTIVVLNCGAPLAMPWLGHVPAVLVAFYAGQEGGNAVARILLGEVNPSGKLPVSLPRRLEENPTYVNYPGGREVLYGERIYVGYRYYDKMSTEPMFPFGHGLSYTTFTYGKMEISGEFRLGEHIGAKIPVRNTGRRAGSEVVQLYVRDRECSVDRPPKELKGFRKVRLEPGQSSVVSFELDERSFAFYDPERKGWRVEPGEFEILIGSSSRDIRARAMLRIDGLEAEGQLPQSARRQGEAVWSNEGMA